jgi:GT2 family glycosyltransferase
MISGASQFGDGESATAHDQRERADGDVERPAVSVVIPTLNEEEHVRTCIESVFRAFRGGPSFEIVLVDSNSDDGTVEIASEYPITVLRIQRTELTTPGAGRYVGTRAASGEQILFVDADMEIADSWISEAQDIVKNDDAVAGVDGHRNDTDAETVENVDALHGVMLYDTEVLAEVGGFDPFLQGYEDIDLGYRVRMAGYELRRLPVVVADHSRPYGISQLKRRWETGYLFGFGQTTRKFLTSPRALANLLLRKPNFLLFLTWLACGVAVLVLFPVAISAWLLVSVGLFVADALWEGAREAANRWINLGMVCAGFCRGVVMNSPAPREFPLDSVATIDDGEVFKIKE